MGALRWWMRGIGVMYLGAGMVGLFGHRPMIARLFPGAEGPGDTYLALGTALSVWGVYVAVIGGALLVGSRSPLRHGGLVGLAVAIEIVAVLGDAWLGTLAHVNQTMVLGAIPLHFVMATAGLLLWRRAARPTRRANYRSAD